jgi:hypothetical protein
MPDVLSPFCGEMYTIVVKLRKRHRRSHGKGFADERHHPDNKLKSSSRIPVHGRFKPVCLASAVLQNPFHVTSLKTIV